ncbi:MAG: hypothetical protein AAB011_01785 [Candidatus Eisenbacteria bacterium]
MMLRGLRRTLWFPAALALLLIGVWVGVGLVHEHTGTPTCQICNVTPFGSADLVAPIVMAEPAAAPLLTALPILPSAARPHPPIPPGRAPPIA